MRKENLRKGLRVGKVHGDDIGRAVSYPVLQLVPELHPALLKLRGVAPVELAQLDEARAVGNELADLGAQEDGVVGVHVRGGLVAEESGSLVLVGVGGEPVLHGDEGALRAIGDEGAAEVYRKLVWEGRDRFKSVMTNPFLQNTRIRLGACHR